MNNIAIGFANGIGNLIILTTLLQSLSQHYNVDLVLDEKWQGEGRDAVELIARNLPFVKNIINFPSEFQEDKYQIRHMSYHSVFDDSFFAYLYGKNRLDPDQYISWAETFCSERDFYFFEAWKKIRTDLRICKQFYPIADKFEKGWLERKREDDWYDEEDQIHVCISNGYQRTDDGQLDRKAYPYWDQVIERILDFFPNVIIRLIGGKEDFIWGESLQKKFDVINCQNLCGMLNILESARIIDQSDLVLSTDTGCSHIADALNKRGLILFGATLVSKNGSLNNGMVPLTSKKRCSPCQYSRFWNLCQERDCLSYISPDLIMATIRRLLRE